MDIKKLGASQPTPKATPAQPLAGKGAPPNAQPLRDQVDLSGARPADAPPPPTAPAAKKKWTVLAYLDGNTPGTQAIAPAKLRQLEIAGTDANVNIVAQMSRQKGALDRLTKDWTGTNRYLVEKNPNPPGMQEELINWFVPPYTQNIVSKPVQEMGPNVNMGDSKTLTDFLKWGMKNYPADHYAVVMYGQGGGFTGSMADTGNKGVISNKALDQALLEASMEQNDGKKFDVVAMDANLMGQVEVGAALKDTTKYLVASEGNTQLGSIPLDMVMKDLRFALDEKEVSAEDLSKFFLFESKYQPGPLAELVNPTLSVMDLDKIDGVKNAAGRLAASLLTSIKKNPNLKDVIREDIKKTQGFMGLQNPLGSSTAQGMTPGPTSVQEPYGDFRDLADFAQQLAADPRLAKHAELQQAAKDVMAAVPAALLGETHSGPNYKGSHGISAYLPTDFGYDLPPTWKQPKIWDPTHGHGETALARETQWDGVLKSIAKDTAFHERLRNMGVGDDVINKIDKSVGFGKKVAAFGLGFAGNAAHYESYQASRHLGAKKFMGIPAQIAAKLGVLGGSYETFNAAKGVLDAAKNPNLKNKQQAIVDGTLDTATGLAVTAANIGLVVAQAAGIASPAGMVAFGLPFAKMFYDIHATASQTKKAKAELDAIPVDQKLNQMDAAIASGDRTVDDQKEYYISPMIKQIVQAKSAGPIDTGMMPGQK